MFSTKFGLRSQVQPWTAAERSSTFPPVPVIGQLVSIDDGSASTLKAPGGKSKKTSRSLSSSSSDIGKLRLAMANGDGKGIVDGIIVQVSGSTVYVSAPGEAVPLSLFGSLSQLVTYGNTNILYLSESVPGFASPIPPPPGYYLRRVIRSPKYFSRLIASDLDVNSPTAIYVALIEEEATPL